MEEQQKQLSKAERRELKKQQEIEAKEKAEKNKKNRNIIFTIIISLLLLVGGWWVWQMVVQVPSASSEKLQNPLAVYSDDWVKGDATASATLLEYADYQCPACAAYSSVVQKLEESYGGNLRVVYRHFPLREIHQNAMTSARTAEAAGRQGKFWEMSSLLYSKQSEWSTSSNAFDIFKTYVQQLGLNIDQFTKDYNDSSLIAKINQDRASGEKLGIEGTPTFFLNGQKLNKPRSFEDFKKLIDEQIAKNKVK